MHRSLSRSSNRMVRGRQIGVIKSATLQCLVRHGPRRPRYRIQIAGSATDHHRAYSFHWLPVTSRMHDATIRCTASAILATLPGWNTNAFSFLRCIEIFWTDPARDSRRLPCPGHWRPVISLYSVQPTNRTIVTLIRSKLRDSFERNDYPGDYKDQIVLIVNRCPRPIFHLLQTSYQF